MRFFLKKILNLSNKVTTKNTFKNLKKPANTNFMGLYHKYFKPIFKVSFDAE